MEVVKTTALFMVLAIATVLGLRAMVFGVEMAPCAQDASSGITAVRPEASLEHARRLFLQWRFSEAESSLELWLEHHGETADAPEVQQARELLARINPSLHTDACGILEGYRGRFANDTRFLSLLADMPRLFRKARHMLQERLGVQGDWRAVIEFVDAADTDGGGSRAWAATIAVDYRPFTKIVFVADFAVLDADDFARRLTHELKHALFRSLMGRSYLDLPCWIAEGLALYGAGQTNDRVAYLLCCNWLRGRGTGALLDGIADDHHDGWDYLEDALCFQWLETFKPGAVRRFCARLVAGEHWRAAFEAVTSMAFSDALAQADAFCRDRIEALMGAPVAELDSIRVSRRREGPQGRAWFASGGEMALRRWLSHHNGHVLAPVARLYLGEDLVLTGRSAEGRRELRRVRDAGFARCNLAPAAQRAIARSYARDGDVVAAQREQARLARDYGWSREP